MDIPRGHAMLPLNETDFLDFIYNYYKAEYAPIRSLWSTATAIPNSPQRWQRMGNELFPVSFRPANAQAQKDLDSLDHFIRKYNLDATFLRGILIRYAKYEEHDRLEKKLYECSRLDLMVRKALKEKHLIDKLWPSPAPRDIPHQLLQQGVQVRKWYGDMFGKYFKQLHSVEDFVLRPEVDAKIKTSTTLMLVPWVEHLVFGTVDPIMPIVAKGSGYSNTGARNKQAEAPAFGEPARFDIRFDAPAEVTETYVKNAVRQCQCLKCGSKRDVHVNISVDPNPGPVAPSEPRRRRPNLAADGAKPPSRAAHRYRPGYNMPNDQDTLQPQQPSVQTEPQSAPEATRSPSPEGKKQCPRCTFLNHPELSVCEMCQAELPSTIVASTTEASPPPPQSGPSHSHSASVPLASTQSQKEGFRPSLPNRQSLGSTLFSIFPFSQQHQSEHHANLPPTQPSSDPPETKKQEPRTQTHDEDADAERRPALPARRPTTPPPPPTPIVPSSSTNDHDHNKEDSPITPLSSHREMVMMPLTPPPPATSSASHPRTMPAGMPQNLMDDFVPVSSSPFLREQEEEDAGWGEMSREEARRDVDNEDEEDDDDGGRGRQSHEGLLDLDAVAREEMGVWGEET